MQASRALFRQYPELTGKLPFVGLGDFPTPVAAMDALRTATGLELGNDINQWARHIQGNSRAPGALNNSETLIAQPPNSSADTLYR